MRPGLKTTALRDAATWVLGWVIIFKQSGILFDPPAQHNETLIWMAGALIGVPGIAELWRARSGQPTGTGAAGSSPAPVALPPSSPGVPLAEDNPAS